MDDDIPLRKFQCSQAKEDFLEVEESFDLFGDMMFEITNKDRFKFCIWLNEDRAEQLRDLLNDALCARGRASKK